MKEEKYQILISKYEKLEAVLKKTSSESEKISEDFHSSNGKLLTLSMNESINYIDKILKNHRTEYLSEFENKEEFFSFLSNGEIKND